MLPVRTSSLLLGVNENKSSAIHKTRDTSKMILRIEDFLPPDNKQKISHNSVQHSIHGVNSINHTQLQVISLEYLKSGLASHEFSTTRLSTFQPIEKCFIQKSNDGHLHSINGDNNLIWLRSVQFSEDIYNQNAIFELTKSNKIRLRLIKDVTQNEEIIGWFSEEIAMLLSIPFLTPTNIRGNNCYRCHLCSKSFESPNPLKIHITTDCENQSVDVLWSRLHMVQKSMIGTTKGATEEPAITNSTAITTRTAIHNEHKVPESLVFPTSSSASSISSSSSLQLYGFPHITENFRRFSAFTPMMSSNFHRHNSSMLQCFSDTTFVERKQQFLIRPQNSEFAAINAAAQIETLVSNMSTSKQGHLCIYCGKIYSRKYGLKIHIRTHTGFKPLKCKYCLRPFGDPSNLNKHIRLHLQTTTRNSDHHISKNTEIRTQPQIDLINDHNSRCDRMSSSDDD